MTTRIEVESREWGGPDIRVISTFEPAENMDYPDRNNAPMLCNLVAEAERENKRIREMLAPHYSRVRADQAVKDINYELRWLRENGYAVPANIVVEQKPFLQLQHTKETLTNGE